MLMGFTHKTKPKRIVSLLENGIKIHNDLCRLKRLCKMR